MRHTDRRFHFLFVYSAFLLLLASAFATSITAAAQRSTPQPTLMDLSAKGVRIYKPNASGQTLTLRGQRQASSIIKDFLQSKNRSPGSLASLVTTKENADPKSGLTMAHMEQHMRGLKVYGTYVKAVISQSGELKYLIENTVTPPNEPMLLATIDAQQALRNTLKEHYPNLIQNLSAVGSDGNTTSYSAGSMFYSTPTVTRMAIPLSGGAMHEGFLIQTWDNDNILIHTLIDGLGRIVHVEHRTNHDSYNIFPENPSDTPQTIVSGPGGGNAESPIGWVTLDTTIGNNVDAYLDVDSNNIPDAGGRPISAAQDFTNEADLNMAPSTTVNRMVGVQNLFYLNNVIHDTLYRHGFTEAVGNFQEDNFGNGGFGGDSVRAEAQDGGGINNANFATPPDGFQPRMQMFIWNFSSPNRDGTLDSDIVWHEYGHGLTWRMIGSMSGPLAGAVGEGVSDVLAILNGNDVVGEWSIKSLGGIRRYPYAGYPLTYGSVTGESVHQDGEIYAATIWRLWELWQAAGLSKDLLLDYIVGGMNFTPARPAFEDMRDGILAAISDPAHQCIVWDAFSRFGIGDGASGVEIGNEVSITESMLTPPSCVEVDAIPLVTVTDPSDGTSILVGDVVFFTGTANDPEDGDLTADLSWTSSLDGTIGSGGSFSSTILSEGTHTVTASVTDSGDSSASDTITVTVNATGQNTVTVEVRVAAESDDAEERASGTVRLTSSDLELVFDKSDQYVGMRFNGLGIPPGATIIDAYVQFQVDEPNSVFTDLIVKGEANDNAVTFTPSAGNISSRIMTTSQVSWNPAPWATVGEAELIQRTPSIASVIQEIVSLPGWSIGNSLVIIVTGTGERTAESYDGKANAAPLLHVEYVLGSYNPPPSVAITAPTNGSAYTTGTSIDFSGTANDPRRRRSHGGSVVDLKLGRDHRLRRLVLEYHPVGGYPYCHCLGDGQWRFVGFRHDYRDGERRGTEHRYS